MEPVADMEGLAPCRGRARQPRSPAGYMAVGVTADFAAGDPVDLMAGGRHVGVALSVFLALDGACRYMLPSASMTTGFCVTRMSAT